MSEHPIRVQHLVPDARVTDGSGPEVPERLVPAEVADLERDIACIVDAEKRRRKEINVLRGYLRRLEQLKARKKLRLTAAKSATGGNGESSDTREGAK